MAERISSAVFFAAITPASWATVSTSPSWAARLDQGECFGLHGDFTLGHRRAFGIRLVATSTIRAVPLV
jgi:hypothetical protein